MGYECAADGQVIASMESASNEHGDSIDPVVKCRFKLFWFLVGSDSCCVRSLCQILSTERSHQLGAVKVYQQISGAVKSPATTVLRGKTEVRLLVSFNSRKTFRQWPGGRCIHPFRSFPLSTPALKHMASWAQFN